VKRHTRLPSLRSLADRRANRGSYERIKIDGLELGTGFFRSVGGLSAETEVVDYREGGVADFTRKLPGRTKWPNLVLKRGFSADRQLWDWHQTVVAGKPVLRSGSILVYDEEGALVRTFKFKNGWPCKWEGPELDASKNEVAIETIEIAHEGIELE
jgi:phage tail-like protein